MAVSFSKHNREINSSFFIAVSIRCSDDLKAICANKFD